MKDEVRKLLAEWDQSLHLPSHTYWKLEGVTDPRIFLRHLPKLFPHGMTLLIEGLDLGLSAKSLYEEHPARYTRKVACDTISPTPDSYHVEFSPVFSDRLCQLIQSQGRAAALDHFKGYSEREVVFSFHDAFEGEPVFASNLGEAAIREFTRELNCTAELVPFPVDLRANLRAIDRALNPPWWRRALRFFARKEEQMPE